MTSSRFTKTNIDRDVLAMLDTIAAARGISTAALLEQIVLFYLVHGGKKEAVK